MVGAVCSFFGTGVAAVYLQTCVCGLGRAGTKAFAMNSPAPPPPCSLSWARMWASLVRVSHCIPFIRPRLSGGPIRRGAPTIDGGPGYILLCINCLSFFLSPILEIQALVSSVSDSGISDSSLGPLCIRFKLLPVPSVFDSGLGVPSASDSGLDHSRLYLIQALVPSVPDSGLGPLCNRFKPLLARSPHIASDQCLNRTHR